MRRKFLLILVMLVSVAAYAQDTAKVRERSFSLNGGLAFDNYGRLGDAGKSTSTEYAGFRITPDWRFAKHWGLKLDLGAGWAFTTNVTDVWEKPMHSICNVGMKLAPYYEFNIKNWFIDLGPVVSCRLRLPYMNGESSRYLQTLSIGVGLDFRFGYMFADRWGVFAACSVERTVYDLLCSVYYATPSTSSGCIAATIGVVYKIFNY